MGLFFKRIPGGTLIFKAEKFKVAKRLKFTVNMDDTEKPPSVGLFTSEVYKILKLTRCHGNTH